MPATHPFLIDQTPFLAIGQRSSLESSSCSSSLALSSGRTTTESRAGPSRPSLYTHLRTDSSTSLSSLRSSASTTSSSSASSTSSASGGTWESPRPRVDGISAQEDSDVDTPRSRRHAETEAVLLGKSSRRRASSEEERTLRREMAVAERGYAMIVDLQAEKEAKRSRRMGMIF